jgi:glycosyltransferase involved in cell wall biosynthesis
MNKPNVLFVGSYREKTGFGIAAQNFIRALDTAANVACRPVKIRQLQANLHPRILELENVFLDNYDYVIQKVLPHNMDYCGDFKKNVAILAYETNSLGRTIWPERLELMDEIWATNKLTKKACENSKITKPVKIIGEPVDVEKFGKVYRKMTAPIVLDSTFKFYFIGEHTPRKNLEALVKAFHVEFRPEDDVALFIKTNRTLTSPQETQNQVAGMCTTIKQNLRMYDHPGLYKPEIILTDYVSDDDICSLHQMCDCFVLPSCGEGWCMPALDSLGFSNPVICGAFAGMDYVNDNNGWLVNSYKTPVVNGSAPLTDLYTGHECHEEIDIIDLQKQMRLAYESRHTQLWKDKQQAAKETPYEYTFEKIGQRMLGYLEETNVS